ncbi:MAG: 4Fe-4S binding protein [Firmicutes bacterium]|nr:4Fe-4S binding protein [Bacillota bacterium]
MENNKVDTIKDYVNNNQTGNKDAPAVSFPDFEYAVTGICIGCGKCLYVCPADCIVHDGVPYYIDASKCLSCGSCRDVCPVGAVSML